MSLLDVGKLALITVTPTLIGALVVYAPKWCSAVARAWPRTTADEPVPAGPPIEQLAADLRRLLRLHDELTGSAHIAMRAHRLWAVEAAISVRAVEAAQALDVPHLEPAPDGMLSRTELGRLLHALADSGLVLPATVGPFTKDGRI
ncbi:hypothetical protein [Actinoplanes friuliensis]|uniref:Uncharacterized protein n=1 Tax=Actinoplanes friuliensis DSM 7358 TaxID=1246995 RepID=U5W603_9ACTN|nr:hypothetical protein [Actinoplanes friuliensis]AGZ43381.1 hypothetical protein AFR_25585 [Actinoplanes friuliensis DSM 7358]